MKDSVPFSHVFKEELRAIETRRRSRADATGNANQALDASKQRANEPSGAAGSGEKRTDQDLVGLALSGGGVRSASFNLGLIQALDRHGVFTQVDYLSTVSGGGFVGGYVSSLSLDSETKISEQQRSSTEHFANRGATGPPHSTAAQGEVKNNAFDQNITGLAPSDNEPQPKRVRKLIYSGDYLRLPLNFFNRYLIGLVFISGIWVSGVMTVGAGLAWLFRTLDGNQMRYFLRALGFYDDVARALFPSFVFGLGWLLAWSFSYWQNRSAANGKVARLFLAGFVASLLIAFVMLLGTGAIDMGKIASYLKIQLNDDTIRSIQGALKVAVIVPLLLFLLPYFRPSRLLKSGRDPGAKWWERAIFRFSGFALLIGIPLLFFGVLARENISNWNNERPGTLAANDVNWTELTRIMSEEDATLAKQLWTSEWQFELADQLKKVALDESPDEEPFDLSDGLYDSQRLLGIADEYVKKIKKLRDGNDPAPVTFKDFAKQIDEVQKDIKEIDAPLSFHQRWIHLVEWLLMKSRRSGDDELEKENEVYRVYKFKRDEYFLKTAALAIINREALLDSELYKKIKAEIPARAAMGTFWTPEKKSELEKLVAEAGKSLKIDENDASSIESTQRPKPDPAELTKINRRLLTAYFGKFGADNKDVVEAKDAKLSLTFVLKKDQEVRLRVFWWSLALLLVLGLLVNLNLTSLQGYYRNQVANTWIESIGGFQRRIPLARLDTTAQGHPYHLICATANFIRRQERSKGRTGHFLFSNLYCGSDRTGYQPTTKYSGGTCDLASAVALSGAAVTPAQVDNLLLVVLMFIMNVRLGQWLPNPGHDTWQPALLSRAIARWPSPLLVLASLLRRSESRAFCLVTDGGHYENLGIGALLSRRCRLIIASDAGHDPKYDFLDLSSLLRRERVDNGVQIRSLDSGVAKLEDLLPDEERKLSKAHWVIARIDYPNSATSQLPPSRTGPSHGYLIYIKPTFIDDEELDLDSQRRINPDFPHDSTSDQFYSFDKFESYRQLGFNIGVRLCKSCFQNASLRAWTPDDVHRETPPADRRDAEPLGPAPSTDSSQDEVEEKIATMSGVHEGDSAQRQEAAEFLGHTLLDEGSEVGCKRIVESMCEVFRKVDEDMELRLILAETLTKAPSETQERVRQEAVARSLDEGESVETRRAALRILDCIGWEDHRDDLARLLDLPDIDAKLRKEVRDLLGLPSASTDS